MPFLALRFRVQTFHLLSLANKQAVQRYTQLLEDDEKERRATIAMIEREAAYNKNEAKRQQDEQIEYQVSELTFSRSVDTGERYS